MFLLLSFPVLATSVRFPGALNALKLEVHDQFGSRKAWLWDMNGHVRNQFIGGTYTIYPAYVSVCTCHIYIYIYI